MVKVVVAAFASARVTPPLTTSHFSNTEPFATVAVTVTVSPGIASVTVAPVASFATPFVTVTA